MRIFAFGDSFTEGYKVDAPFHPYTQYKKVLGVDSYSELPPIWTELLSEEFNCEVFNFAKGGLGNESIFSRICQNVNNFQKDDVVIINWTFFHRFRWAIEPHIDGDDKPFYDVPVNVNLKIDSSLTQTEITQEVIDRTSLNRLKKSWINTILDYERVIDRLAKEVGFDVFYWATDSKYYHYKDYKIEDSKYILYPDIIDNKNNDRIGDTQDNIFFKVLDKYGALSLLQEGKVHYNSQIDDEQHRGGIGHKIQAELFAEWIKKYSKKSLYNSK